MGSSICTAQYANRSSKAARVRWEFQKGGWIHYSVQTVYMHKDEGSSGRGADPMSVVVCVKRISRHLEGGLLECETVGEFLADIKKELGGGKEELVKAAEL